MLCACGCNQETPIAIKTDARRDQRKGEPMKFCPGHNSQGTKKAPNPVRALATISNEITEQEIIAMRSWDDIEAADRFDARTVELESFNKRSYIELGMILVEVEDRKLHLKIVDHTTDQYFTSFDTWLEIKAPISRAGGYAAKTAIRKLRNIIPLKELQDMPRYAVTMAAKLPPKRLKEPEVLKALKNPKSEKVLDAFIEKNIPEAHIEEKKKMILKPEKSVHAVMDKAAKMCMELTDCKTREEAYEYICAEYIESHEDEYHDAIQGRLGIRPNGHAHA